MQENQSTKRKHEVSNTYYILSRYRKNHSFLSNLEKIVLGFLSYWVNYIYINMHDKKSLSDQYTAEASLVNEQSVSAVLMSL